ncbi:sulfatase [Halomontanus rarus]|uniref:sulfatase n=1 Tax=Halomontanus rarus TaxID=3034020 RepID=UPI0023E8BB99|nr:sulfatase [Halovivax sp. TS33]
MSDLPNVVWVTLDSVRTDHTTMSGYRRDTTPNLARIAADGDGQQFSNCFSHGIWTLASSASILTGTYPSRHDVGLGSSKLSPKLSTAGELFSEQGYRTACLSCNSHISDATDLSRGFDRFEWLSSSTLLQAAGLKTTLEYGLNIRKHSAGFTTDPNKHSTPFLMNEIATRWLDSLADEEPFFFYLHYNEPHRPYYPPRPYLDRYTDDIDASPQEAVDTAMRVHENLYEIVANGCQLSTREWESLRAMYDAEIAYTDEMIGQLFDHVRSRDLEDTIFVITADHGELFGEYGLLAHKLCLHDGVINVPLVIHGLEALSSDTDEDTLGAVTDEDALVQHADVMQTLVTRAGGRTDDMQGIDIRTAERKHAIAQRGTAEYEPFLEHNSEFETDRYHDSMLTCLRTDDFKYCYSEDRTELFDLPDEETDVSSEHPDRVERFDRTLTEWLETDGQPIDATLEAEFTDAMEQQLKDLGYIE